MHVHVLTNFNTVQHSSVSDSTVGITFWAHVFCCCYCRLSSVDPLYCLPVYCQHIIFNWRGAVMLYTFGECRRVQIAMLFDRKVAITTESGICEAATVQMYWKGWAVATLQRLVGHHTCSFPRQLADDANLMLLDIFESLSKSNRNGRSPGIQRDEHPVLL